MTQRLRSLAVGVAAAALLLSPFASFAATTTSFAAGDLIKGSGSTVYYFGPDGHRYVFPNEKTYFTWYPDFSTVKQIPDSMLSTLPLARQNVTYRPGVKMLKVTTDPSTYVVDQGGILRHVASEQLAQTLYGLNWKGNVEDLPDAFFVNYKIGTPVNTAADYNPANVMTQTTNIAIDKQLSETQQTVTIGTTEAGFVPTTLTFKAGTTVTWTNSDLAAHTVTFPNYGSGQLQNGDTWSYTFNTPGSYSYKDADSSITGAVNVLP